MKDKRSIALAVILLGLIGFYVWYSYTSEVKKPTGQAVSVTKIDPNQVLIRKMHKAIRAFKKEKGRVPKDLKELRGQYLDAATLKDIAAKNIVYKVINEQAYRIVPPKGGAPVKVAAKAAAPGAKPAAPSGAHSPPAKAKELITTETGWRYEPRGRPDPFKPFIVTARAETAAAEAVVHKPLTPLQRMPLSEIQRGLKAIVWGPLGNKAMVEDATGKGYVISEGTYVGQNDGIVKKILQDRIIVEEYRKDPIQGRLVTNEVVLKLKKVEEK